MSLPFATETIAVRRAPNVKDHGANVADWGNATDTPVPDCSVKPLVGSEDLVNRDEVIRLWTVITPPTADVLPTDRVVWQGDVYEVDGSVQPWSSGILDHLRFTIKRVTG